MYSVASILNQLLDGLAPLIEDPELVRDTAAYQAMIRIRDDLIAGGVAPDVAERTVLEAKVSLPPTFHHDSPETFERLVSVFSDVLLNIERVVSEDFELPDAFLALASQFEIKGEG